ncbi:Flavodoxin domain-containing protein [Echria macrotheca]|uniref:Flavodoxin domain-containing protein n=1 Tax=Echria macrotheca TaxID=438768 RepID=A0AAJ0BHW0_9PEZI|nr:Flavodoxin domain-containing protein [Echria macrotheca]
MSILIAIATAHNTTRDIAQRIATRLGTFHPTLNKKIDVLDVASVPPSSLPTYDAIIVGSAVHMQRWLSPARSFIHQNRQVLAAANKPTAVWAFSVGVPETAEHAAKEAAKIEGEIKRDVPGLRGHVLFKGRIEREHLPWPVRVYFRWFPGTAEFGDFVEWERVDEWADVVGREVMNGGGGDGGKPAEE